ncbi:MAG: hypothetical protein ACYS71_02100, partial [Planctomycetota bacterium]
MALNAESFKQVFFEFVNRTVIHVTHIYQQNLRRTLYSRLLIDKCPPAVNDSGVVELLDFAKGFLVLCVYQTIDGG